MSCFRLEFDGVSRGNPGHAGAAAALYEITTCEEEGGEYKDCVWYDSDYLGSKKTNNQAEYSALIIGLKQCVERRVPNLEICGDSELVIRQLTGQYQVNHKKLIPLHRTASQLINSLQCQLVLKWIPREENKFSDQIANLVVDRELNGYEEEEEELDEMEKEIEERGEHFGFTKAEFEFLICNGLRPWKEDYSECWDFIQAYNDAVRDDDDDDDGAF